MIVAEAGNRLAVETLSEAGIAQHRAGQIALADAAVRSGFCPDCGRSDFDAAAANGTRMLRCIDCGAAFLIEKPLGANPGAKA